MGVILLSAGLMVWQMDFATKERTARNEPPAAENPYPGVPPWLTERAPAVARMIDGVQVLFRGGEETAEKPTIRRGTRTQPDNWDIRYTKRPGEGR